MTRLLIHPLYNFVLVLALCVSVGVAGFLLTHSHFFSAIGRRSSISVRPYRRTPTVVVSRPLQRSRLHMCWLPVGGLSKESF